MKPNSTPPEGLCGPVAASGGESKDACADVANGPQVGVYGFESVEVLHWDAEKTAEAARLLAEHPPRSCIATTTIGWTEHPKETS